MCVLGKDIGIDHVSGSTGREKCYDDVVCRTLLVFTVSYLGEYSDRCGVQAEV